MKRALNFSVTVGVVTILLVSIFLPLQVSAYGPSINAEDGTWTDIFDQQGSVTFFDGTSECNWTNGSIALNQTTTSGRYYNFNDGGSHAENDHKAYYFQSVYLLSLVRLGRFLNFRFNPAKHTARETEFGDEFYYPSIEEANETVDPYAQSSAAGLNNFAIQHFRFKIDGTADTIGEIEVYWEGKAENAKNISLYYWRNADMPVFSGWTSLQSTSETGEVMLRGIINITKLEDPFDENNYLDIFVVAVKKAFFQKSTLFTDYVRIKATQQTGYNVGYALVQTKNVIELPTGRYWELFTWEDYESGSATVSYQILHHNGSAYVPFKNSELPGNEQGFTTPPVSLTPLSDDYRQIKIQGNLTTKNPAVAPRIYKWVLAWQKEDQWKDTFISEYRVDQKNKVIIRDGSVNISLVSGDWPMFGQNPTNNRVMDGPAATTGALYWYSTYHELWNQTLGNPIIDGESLYVVGTETDTTTPVSTLYKIPSIIVASSNIGEPLTDEPDDLFSSVGHTIIGTPAVSDEYIVFSTGEKTKENYVYVLDKQNTSNFWKFDYETVDPDEPKVCYWGSPVIADGLVYLTCWGGQPSNYHVNNMVLVLDPSTEQIWKYHFPEPDRPILSPTWSFSTPAVSEEGVVVVGCMNDAGDNLFAFQKQQNQLNFTVLWNASVNGAIGTSSPVLYNDTVYIVSEKKERDGLRRRTQVSAVDLNDGRLLWTVPIGEIITTPLLDQTFCLAQATPAIVNDVLYITTPVGTVVALNIKSNGSELWRKEVYPKSPLSSTILTASPSYAEGLLYIGTPAGSFYALDTKNNGAEVWQKYTYPDGTPVVTDPIVSNGIVFYAGGGRLYARGSYTQPNKEISGSITSVPITLPTGSWWKKFYAQVQTNGSASINRITFSILDEDGEVLREITNRSDILQSNRTIGRTIQLHADFWAKNSSVNPQLFYWNVTFEPDPYPPFINQSTLTPSTSGYLNEVVPEFTVKVKDNHTGLLVNSARYTLEYILDGQTKHDSYPAVCTGINGTKAVETITVNISTLDFYANITELKRLWINISDLAGNQDTLDVRIKQDRIAPNSSVKPQGLKTRYNATAPYVRINATSFDNGTDASGIYRIDLYYRYSSTGNFNGTDWIYFANATKRKNPTWRFNFTEKPTQKGGYFELCTIATDNASNVEDFPTAGDVGFIYDWKSPDLPNYAGDTLWFKERPLLSVVFKDDFRLHTIRYRPNFETSWTTIASKVNTSTYSTPWLLKEEYWDQMEEDEIYYLYFQINDTVGNTLTATSESTAIIIRKDTFVPSVTIDLPQVEPEWIWEDNFTVSAFVNDRDGSGVDSVVLYYRFSKDKTNWTDWAVYGDALSASPFEWDFSAAEGDGYYEFKIIVTDIAGNEAESEVLSSAVNSFPTTLVFIMVGLIILLAFISAILFIKWKKRK